MIASQLIVDGPARFVSKANQYWHEPLDLRPSSRYISYSFSFIFKVWVKICFAKIERFISQTKDYPNKVFLYILPWVVVPGGMKFINNISRWIMEQIRIYHKRLCHVYKFSQQTALFFDYVITFRLLPVKIFAFQNGITKYWSCAMSIITFSI